MPSAERTKTRVEQELHASIIGITVASRQLENLVSADLVNGKPIEGFQLLTVPFHIFRLRLTNSVVCT